MTDDRQKKQKKAAKATHRLVKAIDDDPYNVENYYELGTILTEMQSFPQAEELFKKALTIFTKDQHAQSLLHYGLGNVFYSSGLYKEAVEEFQYVTDNNLKSEAYLMIAQAYFAQQNYQQAMAFALTASDNLPHDKEPKKLMADCFFALGDFKTAISFYQQVLTIDDKDVHTLFQLGLAKYVTESQEAGQKYFEKVKQLDFSYYQRMQSRLSDIENALKAKGKDNG